MIKLIFLNILSYIYLLLVLSQVNSGNMKDWLGMTLFLMFASGVLIFSYIDYNKTKKDYALFCIILGYVNIIGFSIVYLTTYFL